MMRRTILCYTECSESGERIIAEMQSVTAWEHMSNSATETEPTSATNVGGYEAHKIRTIETFVVRHDLSPDEQFEYSKLYG